MNIHQIAEKLNSLSKSENFEIAKLPELRKKYLKKKILPDKIFTSHTIFSNGDIYAFHYGGRDEIQFNIGADYINDNACTRYAICFSLESSRSLPNPVHDLQPFRLKFNECITKYPELFTDLDMWYFQDNKRHGNFSPQQIPDDWFQENTFIAIGKLIEKPLESLNEVDLIKILNGFDKFLPIYKYCVFNSNPINVSKKRISKVCWNENNWTSPSGPHGKSRQINSYETERGYGHEEWLFDFDKIIDGYHYAFLQSVENGRTSFLNKYFNVRLFSRNSEIEENFWIGSIDNLEVISEKEAKTIHSKYIDSGWLQEMERHIKSVDGDVKHFQSLKPGQVFNIRFKPENARLYSHFQTIENFKSEIGTYHYQFIKDKLKHKSTVGAKIKRRNYKFKPKAFNKSLATRIINRQQKASESEPIHAQIEEILCNHLVTTYGENSLSSESDTGLSTRIDISVRTADGFRLYEVKSYPSVKISIRQAVGQLLEYAYYPNPIMNLSALIIVSHLPIDDETKEYLEFLRETSSLPIYYQSVDLVNAKISEIE